MEWIEVSGGRPLNGVLKVQGSKNAALPILAGSLLHKGRTILHHCPRIQDVDSMVAILRKLGCEVVWEADSLSIDAGKLKSFHVPHQWGERMRSSVILLGSLLGRMGKADLPYPGGCTIGERPIDIHLAALSEMGVRIISREKSLEAVAEELTGQRLRLRFPSVGATENVILAAVLANGRTILENGAREPEIEELCRFLKGKGAKIEEKEGVYVIDGVEELSDSEFCLVSDRIVAGTYLFAAAATRGAICLEDAPVRHMTAVLDALRRMGAVIRIGGGKLLMDGRRAVMPIPYLKTEPYPGFPTDLQSPLLAALAVAEGESCVEETIFEARFHVIRHLNRMGADIRIDGNRALLSGVGRLHGTYVKAEELRGGAALLAAALAAEGTTLMEEPGYIRRGYEDIFADLGALGASIRHHQYGG